MGAAAAGQRLLGRLPSHRRRARPPSPMRWWTRRAACWPSTRPAGARRRAQARCDNRVRPRVWRSCSSRQQRIRANGPANAEPSRDEVQLQKCPGYCCSYPLIALDQARRGAAGQAFRPRASRRPRPSSRSSARATSIPCAARRTSISARVCRFFDTEKRCCTIYAARPARAAAIPAAAAATTTSCRSSARAGGQGVHRHHRSSLALRADPVRRDPTAPGYSLEPRVATRSLRAASESPAAAVRERGHPSLGFMPSGLSRADLRGQSLAASIQNLCERLGRVS